MPRLPARFLFVPWFLLACGEAPDSDDAGPERDGGVDAGVVVATDCPSMFAQDRLPTYYLDLAPAERAALEDEFHHRPERVAAGLDPTPYHVVRFRYDDGARQLEATDVRVRLKGQSSWIQTLALDANPKMQLVISFNEVNPDGRFLGVRKLDLDMPRTDQTFIRQRLALRYLRATGVTKQCANNARLVLDGVYYGLYTNLERFDKELLQRMYGHADADGDLWKGARIIQTNEETFVWDRLVALWGIIDLAQLAQLADLDASVRAWAAEMMAGDVDGYGNGGNNFYVYDHPTRGFLWVPADLDTCFDPDFLPADSSPVFLPSPFRWERDWYHYLVVMNDPAGFERYVRALGEVRARYDVAALQADVDAWAAQIAVAAAADPHHQFTTVDHERSLAVTRSFIAERAAGIDTWLACRGGGGADRDGDGFDLCHDCNDRDPAVNPGMVERCNLLDDNCNGRVDDTADDVLCE